MSDILLENQHTEIAITSLNTTLTQLRQRREALSHLRTKISNDLKTQPYDPDTVERWTRDASILLQKSHEYDLRIQQIKDSIDDSLAQRLDFDTLDTLRSQLILLKTHAAENKQRLESFENLPPDITLAKIKLAESRQWLAELVDKRQTLLENMLR
ncbi:hypothetical protein BC829DRAFT_429918 [Chytridium lagenaria]|nr:hypothetical protein BC829DRAFT_429918 [Chytridium lagenaria]